MIKNRQPTVFHITNYKAGSQWVASILKGSDEKRCIQPKAGVKHFFEKAIRPGKIYPTVYITRSHFIGTLLDGRAPQTYYAFNAKKNIYASAINRYHFRFQKHPYKIFIVIRDLRDILISQYFSVLLSHPKTNDGITKYRQELSLKNREDGFLSLMNKRLPLQAAIQQSWLPAWQKKDALLIRYEDLIKDEYGCFKAIIEHCQVNIGENELENIIFRNSFGNRTGRQPGEEDVNSHHRKGIAGDWKNYFTDNIKKEFKQKFGQLLIDTEYEKDLNW